MKNEIVIRNEAGMVAVAQNFLHNNGEIIIPKNYDVVQAVKSLYLMCLDVKDKQNRPALEVCTEASIKKCVMELVSKGLNPDKKQCYPIVYGNELKLQVGSFGAVKQAKDVANIKEINANCIHDGDKVEVKYLSNGRMVVNHETNWANFNKPIVGAYATAVYADGSTQSDIMTIAEIRVSWSKSKNNGAVAKEFPVEMAKKTVKARLAKHIINTSDDSIKMEMFEQFGLAKEDFEPSDFNKEPMQAIDVTDFDKQDNNIIIEPQNDEIEPTLDEIENPFEEETSGQEQEEWIELPYDEYRNNKSLYERKRDGYNPATRTILVKRV